MDKTSSSSDEAEVGGREVNEPTRPKEEARLGEVTISL
jgi:hypothetical protein